MLNNPQFFTFYFQEASRDEPLQFATYNLI